jgi:uncharacterized protein YndB with AHSA1/START domain
MTGEIRDSETVVEMRRHLSASPRRVFAAFSERELVRRWLSPSPEIALDILQFDFRVGGIYRFAYRVPGREPMIVNGVYRAIEPQSKIVFSWNIEPPDQHAGLQSQVTVSIASDGDGSLLLIRHENLSLAGAAARHAEGWRGTLDRLHSLLASTEVRDGR